MNHRFKQHSLLALAVASSFYPKRPGNDGVQLMLSYPTQEEIPEAFRPLYTEDNGKFKLTKVVGLKTQDDINALQGALTKERNDHKLAKDSLNGILAGRTAEEVQTLLDSIPALQAAAKDQNVDELVNAKLTQATAPLQRKIDELTQQASTLTEQVEQYKGKEVNRLISDSVVKAAGAAKAIPEAMEDIAFMARSMFEVNDAGDVVAKANIPGVTAGITPEVWITELKRSKPFYWPQTQGAGGLGGKGGGAGNNPFTKENWNLTEQGKLVTSDRSLAEQMAKQAGTTVGGPKPA